jgi:hypothetical protein
MLKVCGQILPNAAFASQRLRFHSVDSVQFWDTWSAKDLLQTRGRSKFWRLFYFDLISKQLLGSIGSGLDGIVIL